MGAKWDFSPPVAADVFLPPTLLGERKRHSRSYGNDEQQRQAGKDAISCTCFGETDYQEPGPLTCPSATGARRLRGRWHVPPAPANAPGPGATAPPVRRRGHLSNAWRPTHCPAQKQSARG